MEVRIQYGTAFGFRLRLWIPERKIKIDVMSANATGHQRRGAIGVIVKDESLLVIERSQTVRAPGRFCFPGGEIEIGESEEDAVKRELIEELNVRVDPIRRLWQSETQSGVLLLWWLVHLPPDQIPRPNPDEVARAFWMSPSEIIERRETLRSNREFLAAVVAEQISLV